MFLRTSNTSITSMANSSALFSCSRPMPPIITRVSRPHWVSMSIETVQQTHCLIVCNPSGLQIFPVKFPQIIVDSSDLYCPRRKHIEALQLNRLLHTLRWCSLNVFQTLCHLQKFLLSHPVIFLSSQTLCLRCILPHYPAKGFLHRSYALVKILFLRLLRFLRQSERFITQTANAKPAKTQL